MVKCSFVDHGTNYYVFDLTFETPAITCIITLAFAFLSSVIINSLLSCCTLRCIFKLCGCTLKFWCCTGPQVRLVRGSEIKALVFLSLLICSQVLVAVQISENSFPTAARWPSHESGPDWSCWCGRNTQTKGKLDDDLGRTWCQRLGLTHSEDRITLDVQIINPNCNATLRKLLVHFIELLVESFLLLCIGRLPISRTWGCA